MKFYHWTKKRNWKKIQACGYLKSGTYFAPTPWLWKHRSYGNILLEIDYQPKEADFGKEHNYGFDPPPEQFCVQFNIFKDIPFSEITHIKNLAALKHLKNAKPQIRASQHG
jgi:hypothetical protein